MIAVDLSPVPTGLRVPALLLVLVGAGALAILVVLALRRRRQAARRPGDRG